jgi:hypothetical protein
VRLVLSSSSAAMSFAKLDPVRPFAVIMCVYAMYVGKHSACRPFAVIMCVYAMYVDKHNACINVKNEHT